MSAREVDVARPVVTWLEGEGWDVYQEVEALGSVADLVATRELFPSRAKIVWVVEVKTSMSESLVKQAMRWQPYANYVSVAIPIGRGKRTGGLARRYLQHYGIGIIHVSAIDYTPVCEDIPPKLSRRAKRERIVGVLRDEHKTWAEAGNPHSSRFTPFKDTCRQILRWVRIKPGCDLKYLAEHVQHHYARAASFKSSIPTWALSGHVPGVRVELDGKKCRFYPSEMKNDKKTD